MRPQMIKILHTICNGIAFEYTDYPQQGEIIQKAFARYSDGSIPQGDDIYCQSCKQQVMDVNHLLPLKPDHALNKALEAYPNG